MGIRNSSLDSDHLCCGTESTLSMTCPFASISSALRFDESLRSRILSSVWMACFASRIRSDATGGKGGRRLPDPIRRRLHLTERRIPKPSKSPHVGRKLGCGRRGEAQKNALKLPAVANQLTPRRLHHTEASSGDGVHDVQCGRTHLNSGTHRDWVAKAQKAVRTELMSSSRPKPF